MPNMEKVIAWLADEELYYREHGDTHNSLMACDAIELLKEQQKGMFIPTVIDGKWDGEKCSVCGSEYIGSAPHKWKFCPDCGAKMEGQ